MSASNYDEKNLISSAIFEEISDALSIVEKQLFLPTNNLKEDPKNFRNRILQIGKQVSIKNNSLEKQISTLLQSDNFDNNRVKETLQTMQYTLENPNGNAMQNEEMKQQIDELTDIAYNQNSSLDQLREALKKSLSLNQRSQDISSQITPYSSTTEQPVISIQNNNGNNSINAPTSNYLHSENIMDVKRKEDTQNYNKNQAKIPLIVKMSQPLYGNLDDSGDDVFDDEFSLFSSESQNSRITELENRLRSVTKQNNDLRNQIKVQKAAYQDLQEKSKQAIKQFTDMKAKIDSLTAEKEKLERTLNVAKKKIAQLQKKEEFDYKKFYESTSSIVKQSKVYKNEENLIPIIQKVFNDYEHYSQQHNETNTIIKQIQTYLSIKSDENPNSKTPQIHNHGQMMKKICDKVKEIYLENQKLKEKNKLSISDFILRYYSDDSEIEKIEKERNEVNSILQALEENSSGENGQEGGKDIGTRLKNLVIMRDQLQEEIQKREDELKKLKSQRQALENLIKSIISVVDPKLTYDPTDSSCEPPESLLNNIKELVEEKNKFQTEKNDLLEVQIQVTSERDRLSLDKKKSIGKLVELAKFMNQSSNLNGEENESDLINALENQIQTLNQLLPSSSGDSNEPISDRLNNLLNEYNQLKSKSQENAKLESDLKSISSAINPSSGEGANISDIIENLRSTIKQNQEDEKTIISLLSPRVNLEEDPNSTDSKVVRAIKQLLNELDENQEHLKEGDPQKILSDLAESLNIKLDPNQDVSQLKSTLQKELKKKAEQSQNDDVQNIFDQYQDNQFIKQMQSESNNGEINLVDAFNKLCKEYTELESKYEQEEKSNKESRQKLNEILGFSPTEEVTNEEIQNRISKISSDHSSILNMLGISEVPQAGDGTSELPNLQGEGTVADQVRKLYDENRRLNELLTTKDPSISDLSLTDQSKLAAMNNELNEGLKKLNIDIDNLPEGETINSALLKGLEKIQTEQKEMEEQLSSVNSEKENLNNTIKNIKAILKGASPDFDENAPLDPAQLDQMLTELKTLVASKEKLEAEEKEEKEVKGRMSEIKSILNTYKNENPDSENFTSDEEVNLVDQIRQLVKEKEKLKQSKLEILKVLKIEGNATDDQILSKAQQISDQQEHNESVAELARILNIPNENNETDQELLKSILAKVKSNSHITERSINFNPSENDDENIESNPESIQALKKENQSLKEEIQKRTEALKSIQSMIYPDKQDVSLDELPETFVSDIQKRISSSPKGNDGFLTSNFDENGENEQIIDGQGIISTSPKNLLQENKLLREKLAKAESEIQSLNEKVIENQSRVSGILEERESVSSLIQDLTQTIKKKMSNSGQDESFEDSAVFQKLADISNALSEQNAMLTSLHEEKKGQLQGGSENGPRINDPDSTFSARSDQNIDKIMSILEISPIQIDPNASPDEIRCEKTGSIVTRVRQLKGKNYINSDPYGFPELNQSTSEMYNSFMANDQSEQSFVEEEEEGDSNDPPTYSRDRSNQGHMMMPSRGIQEILNKKNEIIKNQMDAFKRMASSLRINPEQYVNNDSQLIEEVVNHVRRLIGDNDLPGISDEPASFSSEPLTQSDQPYTPRRHNEEEEINQSNKPFKLQELNLKGITHVDDNENENELNSRRPQLTRLDLNGLSQATDDQSQQNTDGSSRQDRTENGENYEYENENQENENQENENQENENQENENQENENQENENQENENPSHKQSSKKKRGRKIDEGFLIQKLNDISSDLSEQQKILKQMEESHKSTTQIKSLERSLADQQGHWNDLRRALGIPEVEGQEEEEDVTDIQNRMLDKIKQLSALHEVSESDQLSTPRSQKSDAPAELENSQVKELTNLLTIANNTIQTYKNEKDKILKILESENQTELTQPDLPTDHPELEPLSEKLDELQSHISANIDAILNIARDRIGQSETEDSSILINQNESGNQEGSNNEDTLATMNENSQVSPIKGPKTPITNAFENLKEELNQLTIDNDEKDKEIKNLTTKVDGLNTIIIEFKDKNVQMINENKALLGNKGVQKNDEKNENDLLIEEEEEIDDLGLVANLKEEVDRLKALIDSTSCSINELNEKRSEIMKSQINTSKSRQNKSQTSGSQMANQTDENEHNNDNENKNQTNDAIVDNQNISRNIDSIDKQTNKQEKEIDQEFNSQDSFSNLSKDSSTPVNSVLDHLRSQMNSLRKSNAEKDQLIIELRTKNEELEKERQTFLVQNGLDHESNSSSANVETDQESELNKQVQMMNEELAARCDEIEKLKALLDQTKNDLQAMKDERDSVMKSLFPDMESYIDDANSSQLLSNLTDLDNQVSQQTDEIKSSTNLQSDDNNAPLSVIIPSQRHKRNVQKSPRSQITDAFAQLKNQIIELTEKNNNLETKLSEAEATIEHLRNERDLFLHGLGSDNLYENNDLSKELFRKLNFLDSQIASQNAEIGDAINTSKMESEMSSQSSSPVPSPKSSRHNRGILSIRAQTNAQFASTLEELNKKLKNLTNENFEKDCRISELEDRIAELENGSNNPKIQTRHVELNLDNDDDNENRKPINKAVRKLSNALDKTNNGINVGNSVQDEEKSQETIQDLRSQIEALTKARESIATLLSEVSHRAKNLVQQISILKANEKGKSKAKSLTQLQELERSALDFNTKLQSSTAEFNLNNSDDNERISVEVQTDKNLEDENSEEKDNKINELKRQIQKLTETKISISKLFREVSKSSKHLVQEINKLRSQPNNSTIEESLNKLESTAEDIATNQSKAEALFNTDENSNENTQELEEKLQIALNENKILKEQLNDAQLKLEAVKESETVISELGYFKKDEQSKPNHINKDIKIEEEEEDKEEVDKNKQIELLQQKIENLTKARESITKLFMEVSRQARSLVEEIKVLKKKNHSSSTPSQELDSIENSAHTIAKSHEKDRQNEEKIQTLENELLLAQKKINELTSKLSKNHDDDGRSKEKENLMASIRSPINIQLETLRKELVVSDINSVHANDSNNGSQNEEDDSEKVRRLQKQVESLQKARASMTELFNEVSNRSKLLVKQMEEFKRHKKEKKDKKEDSSNKNQRVEKLETEIKDLYEAQTAIQNVIESENQKNDQKNSNYDNHYVSHSSENNSNQLLKKQNTILTEKINKLENSLQMTENRNDELVKKLDLAEKKISLIEESDPAVSNFIKVITSLAENEDGEIEGENPSRKENAASLQEKLDNLQEARQSIGNLTNSLAQSAQYLSKSISALKSKNPSSKEISVLEMNANTLNSSLTRDAKLSELTKKTAEYQHRIAELESIIHNNSNNDAVDDEYDDFNEKNHAAAVIKRNVKFSNSNNENNLEHLQNQINQIEAVLNDEDVISEYPLVQQLITRLTQANKNGNRKRFSPPASPTSLFSPASTSDSILKQLKAVKSENESLKKQLANVSEFANERDDIDSILHGEIDNVDTKSSPLVRSVMQLYNIAHEPITEIQGVEKLKKELATLKEERQTIETILSGKSISGANSSLVRKVSLATKNSKNENDEIDSLLNNDQIDDDVSESTLVRQIAVLVKKSQKDTENLSDSGANNDVESLKSQIFELNKQNELKRLELAQISAILNGNEEINGNNFDLNASTDENVVQKLHDTLLSYKNDPRDKLIKEINSLKSHLEKSSNAQLLSTLKQQITELEEHNNELTENLSKVTKERASIEAVVNGKRPTIRTQLVEQILVFIQNTEDPSAIIIPPSDMKNNNSNNNNNSSLMQQINEMNNDNENANSTFNLQGMPISSSNSSLNDELTDGNRVEADSISSIRGTEQNENNQKALLTENETLRQKLSETKELVNVYAHQFSKVEKFLKLKQVGTIAQRAKAIALKINEERKNLQLYEEQNKKLMSKYQKAKKKIIQLQQDQNVINDGDNSTLTHSDAIANDHQNNAKLTSYRNKLSDYVKNMKGNFLALVDTGKSNALTNADQLFTELELAIHMVDNAHDKTNELEDDQ